MKRLSQHIEYLLHTRRVLTLPGVGSFHIVSRPAEYDRENGLFYPPMECVVFTGGDYNDDGVLFNSYLRREGLSYNEAYDLVTDDLDALTELLDSGMPFRINGFGSLESGAEGLEFVNDSDIRNYYAELGLGPVNLSNTGKAASKDTKKKKKFSREFNPDYYYIPIHKKVARIAASFLLVAVVGLFALLPFQTGTKSTHTASIVPVETPKMVTPNIEEHSTQTSGAYENNPEDRYLLIIGSFKTKAEADKFMARDEYGNNSLELIVGPKLYWVSIASSSSKEDLKSLQNSDEFKSLDLSSWVLDREKYIKQEKN